ncbi:hypothetical protein C8K30_10249 [Promicromonospora sp. AC04]|nr:hypothetical protein C8K30_10249 [Promicromonospora sp. AC04]
MANIQELELTVSAATRLPGAGPGACIDICDERRLVRLLAPSGNLLWVACVCVP